MTTPSPFERFEDGRRAEPARSRSGASPSAGSVPAAAGWSLAQAWQVALADIRHTVRGIPLWTRLGASDFRIRYRRTPIGPAWEIVTTVALVAGLGVMFGLVFGRSDESYLAYLAVGLVLWTYLSAMFGGSAGVFTSRRSQILSINNPLYSHVFRYVYVELGALMWRLVPLAALLLLVPPRTPPNPLAAAGGALMLVLTALWVVPLIGVLSTRWHILRALLRAAMRFLFLVTPVFWRYDQLGTRGYLARINPLSSLLDIVRAPLIGEPMWDHAWTMVLLLNMVGIPVTVLVFGHFRRSLATWL